MVGLTKVASRPARKLSRKLWRAGTGTCPRSCKALVPSQRPASVTVKPTFHAESPKVPEPSERPHLAVRRASGFLLTPRPTYPRGSMRIMYTIGNNSGTIQQTIPVK